MNYDLTIVVRSGSINEANTGRSIITTGLALGLLRVFFFSYFLFFIFIIIIRKAFLIFFFKESLQTHSALYNTPWRL